MLNIHFVNVNRHCGSCLLSIAAVANRRWTMVVVVVGRRALLPRVQVRIGNLPRGLPYRSYDNPPSEANGQETDDIGQTGAMDGLLQGMPSWQTVENKKTTYTHAEPVLDAVANACPRHTGSRGGGRSTSSKQASKQPRQSEPRRGENRRETSLARAYGSDQESAHGRRWEKQGGSRRGLYVPPPCVLTAGHIHTRHLSQVCQP
ncbi:hypothetical protein LX36DRAFT_473201 [Colletotrichum falcatum]|nr:hypothetical protein LX36DRAFT_473201 [Colletotrichum falcatum]